MYYHVIIMFTILNYHKVPSDIYGVLLILGFRGVWLEVVKIVRILRGVLSNAFRPTPNYALFDPSNISNLYCDPIENIFY